MTNERTNREWQRIRELANEYAMNGYDVVYPRTKFDLPDFLREEEYIPDLVVTSPEENLIVEVKTTETLRDDKQISRISDIVNGHPHWQFLFVLTNPRTEARQALGPTSARWHDLLEKSRQLGRQAPELSEAAFVLAWAAVEGAIREAAASEGMSSDGKRGSVKSPMSQIRDAAILGLVDRKDIPQLETLFDMRNRLVHATDGPRPSLTDVRFLQRMADEVSRITQANDG